MLWTSDSLRTASMRPSHAALDRRCKISSRQRTWHMQMLWRLVSELNRKGALTTCSSGVASRMTRSITSTVSCSVSKRKGQLHSGFATNRGMWTDTVMPGRLWAEIQDLWWDKLQGPRTDIRRRIILAPRLAARAVTRKSPGQKKMSKQKTATRTMNETTLRPPGNSIQPKSRMTGKVKLTWKHSWLEVLIGSTVIFWTLTLLTHTPRKGVALIRICTNPGGEKWGSRCSETSEARMRFLARDCDSCLRWRFSDVGFAEQQEHTFRGKGKDSINASNSTTNKGKMQGDKGGNSTTYGKGSESRSNGKSTEGKGWPSETEPRVSYPVSVM